MLVACGPAGILLLAILDSSGVPVAGVFDALLILIAVERPDIAWLCAALAVVGSAVGNIVLFWMAQKRKSIVPLLAQQIQHYNFPFPNNIPHPVT